MCRKVVLHGIKIESAAQRGGTGVEHREVVAAGGQERIHGHAVIGKFIDRHATEFHAAVADKLAAFLSREVGRRGVEGVLVGEAIRHLQNTGERLGKTPLLLEQIVKLLAGQCLGH